jgi:hypothetical protein
MAFMCDGSRHQRRSRTFNVIYDFNRGLKPSALDRCISQSSKSDSVKIKDNCTPKENQIIT